MKSAINYVFNLIKCTSRVLLVISLLRYCEWEYLWGECRTNGFLGAVLGLVLLCTLSTLIMNYRPKTWITEFMFFYFLVSNPRRVKCKSKLSLIILLVCSHIGYHVLFLTYQYVGAFDYHTTMIVLFLLTSVSFAFGMLALFNNKFRENYYCKLHSI